MTLVAVAGTGTGVGKTYVGAAVLHALRARGYAVAARKPVQSFAPDDTSTDADVLAGASAEDPTVVCPAPRWLRVPIAPPMAADALGLPPFTIDDLAAEVHVSAPPDALVLVETAGGVRSPIADDGDSAALIDALAPALVVLVADAGLGTINVVRLSVEALRPHPVVVYLNNFDHAWKLHARNAEWLRTREGLEVVTDIEALATRVEPLARNRG
ncbi:MAG: glycine C-acetyltransferase [Actinomycetota bacterium]|nr:glycine C-acetyltransferase [Actinomycetota bacterium]